jgi:hypothetical protein
VSHSRRRWSGRLSPGPAPQGFDDDPSEFPADEFHFGWICCSTASNGSHQILSHRRAGARTIANRWKNDAHVPGLRRSLRDLTKEATMRTTRWTAGLLTAALLATLPLTSADAASGKPSVGECRQLTTSQIAAASDTSAPIACSNAHNDRVIAVPNLPTGVSWSDLSTSAKLIATATKLCYPALRHTLGQTDLVRNRSAYTFLFFEPTSRQRNAGARWMRCDLALQQGATYAHLPTDHVPALSGSRLPDKVARCLVAVSGQYLTTPCKAAHVYRATGSFTIAAKRYPGRKQLLSIGRSKCPAMVSTDTSFRFTWNPKPVWNLVHDRVMVCYSHTRQ